MKQTRIQRLQRLAELQRAHSANQLKEAHFRADAFEEEVQRIETEYGELIRDRPSNTNTGPNSYLPVSQLPVSHHPEASASPDELARKERYREYLEKEKGRTLGLLKEAQAEMAQAHLSLEQSQTAFQRLDCLNQKTIHKQYQAEQRETQRDNDELSSRAAFLSSRNRR